MSIKEREPRIPSYAEIAVEASELKLSPRETWVAVRDIASRVGNIAAHELAIREIAHFDTPATPRVLKNRDFFTAPVSTAVH